MLPRELRMRTPLEGLYDLDTASELVPYLLSEEGITLADLEEIGQLVQDRGYQKKLDQQVYPYADQRFTPIQRPIKPGWNEIDGTLCYDDRGSMKRYTLGPPWSNNSCAVDCALYCAIMLDIGRIQIDQVSTRALKELPVPTAVTRFIVQSDWSRNSTTSLAQQRDYLRECLYEYDPARFPVAPKHLPIAEVLRVCLQSPQMTFTDIGALLCCDRDLRASNKVRPHQDNSVYVLGDHIQTYIQELLDLRTTERPEDWRCTGNPPCTRKDVKKVKLVLDRLPPTLMVHTDPQDRGRCNRNRVFDDLTLRYRRPRTVVTTSYRAVGCVTMSGSGGTSHFKVVWRTPNGFLKYDGLIDEGKAQRIDSWFPPGRRSTDQVIVIFFRLQSIKEEPLSQT